MTSLVSLTIGFADPESFSVVIEPRRDDSTDPIVYEDDDFLGSVAEITRTVYELQNVFADESASLIRFHDWHHRLFTRPRDEETVHVEVLRSNEEVLDEAVMTKVELIRAFIDGFQPYFEKVCEGSPTDQADDCRCLALSVGLSDLEHRLQHYQENDSLDGYQPTIDREHLETFLLECRSRDRLREFVAETGEIAPFVRQLLENDDDEYVETIYRQLFTYERDAVAREALAVLRQHPDERAPYCIVGISQDSDPSLAIPALEVLSESDPEVFLDVASGRLNADEPTIVQATIDGLASLDPETLTSDQQDRAKSLLQRGNQMIDDETIESRIDEALAKFE